MFVLEEAVDLLFHLLGFSTHRYTNDQRNFPDLVALPHSREWLFAIECTGDGIDANSKLNKLATRAKRIGGAHGFETVPVLFTGTRRDRVSNADLDKASKDGIAIITATEAPELIEFAVTGADQDKVKNFVRAHIPQQVLGRSGS
jgi:glutaredoxin